MSGHRPREKKLHSPVKDEFSPPRRNFMRSPIKDHLVLTDQAESRVLLFSPEPTAKLPNNTIMQPQIAEQ